MRLGELKNKLDYVIDEETHRIVLDVESLYGNQAYQIKNFISLSDALTALGAQEWNNFDSQAFEEIKSKYDMKDVVTISSQEYNLLKRYIDNINTKLPLFYSILEMMVNKQNEQIINIKLPEKEDFSLNNLSEINTRLDKLFKEINIDGTYTFKGFDIGTSWYEILIVGTLTYKFLISALKIAQEFFKAEKLFYESGEARMNYKAALLQLKKQEEKIDDKQVKEYAKSVIKVRIEQKIEEIVKELPRNGQTEQEAISKMTKAVTAIETELNNGLEFHLSLNPPKYAEEDSGNISINYNMLREIENKDIEPKQIKQVAGDDANE